MRGHNRPWFLLGGVCPGGVRPGPSPFASASVSPLPPDPPLAASLCMMAVNLVPLRRVIPRLRSRSVTWLRLSAWRAGGLAAFARAAARFDANSAAPVPPPSNCLPPAAPPHLQDNWHLSRNSYQPPECGPILHRMCLACGQSDHMGQEAGDGERTDIVGCRVPVQTVQDCGVFPPERNAPAFL